MEKKVALAEVVKKLGYNKLKGKQEEVILAFVNSKDVFVSLPTRSGKSLCYAVLPWLFDSLHSRQKESLIIVISPLISPMKDQVRSLKERNLTAVCISDVEGTEVDEEIASGCYQVIFMSPEALLADTERRDMLLSTHFQKNLVGFVVDEAHCVKKW